MSSIEPGVDPTAVEPPSFAKEAVADCVAKNYHLRGEYTLLVSERDQNFRLETAGGRKFVAKVVGQNEKRLATDFQIAMLVHFEENNFHYAPRVIKTLRGENRCIITSDSGQEYCLRIVSWLEGRLLKEIGLSTALVSRFGQGLAELDGCLENFHFDGNGQAGLWDMQNALRLRDLLHHVNDDKVHRCTSGVLDRFEEIASDELPSLPKQAIHNDANPENILIGPDQHVSGFIDFGDSVKAPRIIEVATASSYLRTRGQNPLEFIEAFVAGYHQRNPLSEQEFKLLFDLIRTRLTTTLVHLYWRLAARDENDPYRQKTLQIESNAFEFLTYLSELGREAFGRRMRDVRHIDKLTG